MATTLAPDRGNYFFTYDGKGKLIQFLAAYENDFFETARIYTYDSKNRIIADTFYGFGRKDDILNAPGKGYSNFIYDNLNRIVIEKRVLLRPNYVETERTYSYDEAGNLILPGVAYDNKLSIYKSNKIWMFVFKNYSVNNPVGATGYNSCQLPTGFTDGSNISPIFGIYTNDIVPVQMIYY